MPSKRPKKSSKPKKKTASAPSPASKPSPPVKSGLTASELKEYKELLFRRLRVLKGDVSGLGKEAMKTGSGGDLSTLPMHLADQGTDNFEQDISLGIMESESDEMQEIEEAIERIGDGTFGLCENCKKKIPKERLKAIPYTRMCVGCKMKEEGV